MQGRKLNQGALNTHTYKRYRKAEQQVSEWRKRRTGEKKQIMREKRR